MRDPLATAIQRAIDKRPASLSLRQTTVTAVPATGKVTVRAAPSGGTVTVPHLRSYTPAVNDRVWILRTGTVALVLGK